MNGPAAAGDALGAKTTWKPLLEGAEAEEARRVLGLIEEVLLREQANQPSLAGGLSGEALFFTYLNQAEPTAMRARTGQDRIGAAVDLLAESLQMPSLYGGFAGTAWAMEHLQGRLLEAGEEDANEEIDGFLLEYLGRSPWKLDYDLIVGLVGYGLYALERYHRPSGRQLLEKVLDRLEETQRAMDGGLTWHTSPDLLPQWQRDLHPAGYYNLGLAHGVPGVVALLGQACALGVERARPMLEGAVAWMLAHRAPEDSVFTFPTVVDPETPGQETGSRVAWCYGDLGAATALLWAARSVGRSDWEEQALEILRKTARRDTRTGGVMDAGLCHGSAGNAHIFNRLHQATGEELFKEAALAWFRMAMSQRNAQGEDCAGFHAWQPKEDGSPFWKAEIGLLEGICGIGLALVAATSPVRPDWDRMLLVSVEPKA